MDRETLDVYLKYERLDKTVFQGMSIQELFDLRHDMLAFRNKLGELLKQ
ncbi:hypothetical protein [Lutimonas vermicola]|uniref:Uncharacterized protein n=1 Tax=Lutimonas vermicola TaxID=414288 RepID=A0ABU9L3A7_9FLAO